MCPEGSLRDTGGGVDGAVGRAVVTVVGVVGAVVVYLCVSLPPAFLLPILAVKCFMPACICRVGKNRDIV